MAKYDPKTPPGNSPITAFEKARFLWYESVGSPTVDKNRYALFCVFLVAAVIALGLAVAQMLPLVRIQPWVVLTDKLSGAAVAENAATQDYKPELPQIKYFVAEFVTKWRSIDPVLVRKDLSHAFLRTRGKAIEDFKDWLAKDKPIERLALAKDQLSRKTTIISITPMKEDNMLHVRFETVERVGAASPTKATWAGVIHYAIIPPTSEQEILQNPLGLYVTFFSINEELK